MIFQTQYQHVQIAQYLYSIVVSLIYFANEQFKLQLCSSQIAVGADWMQTFILILSVLCKRGTRSSPKMWFLGESRLLKTINFLL